MHRLERRVRFVQGVSIPVIVQALDLAAGVAPHAAGIARVLVDVIPQMDDEVQILVCHVSKRREEALLVVLAGRERESQSVGRRIGRRHRACSAYRALVPADVELVPIPACRRQTVDLDVHRVAKLRGRDRGTLANDVPHAVIGRDTPAHLDRFGRHASTHEWFRR